jgi:phosphopantothenoylcysteine decarboxylase/phosphopantothenate--cysteine ligase
VDVETAEQLRAATLERLDDCDALLMAAAVADYRPAAPQKTKIPKEERERFGLELVRTADVLSEVARRRRPEQIVVGFAAEHGAEGLERARRKLDRKQLDAIVFNDISGAGIGFDAVENEATIVSRSGEHLVSRRDKREVAAAVLDHVQELRTQSGDAARTAERGKR